MDFWTAGPQMRQHGMRATRTGWVTYPGQARKVCYYDTVDRKYRVEVEGFAGPHCGYWPTQADMDSDDWELVASIRVDSGPFPPVTLRDRSPCGGGGGKGEVIITRYSEQGDVWIGGGGGSPPRSITLTGEQFDGHGEASVDLAEPDLEQGVATWSEPETIAVCQCEKPRLTFQVGDIFVHCEICGEAVDPYRAKA